MRKLQTLAWVSGNCLWILAIFAISLVLLGALSKSSQNRNIVSGNKHMNYEFRQIHVRVPLKGSGYPPVLAYWICGSSGDANKILRLLKAVYHPRNQYLLQLDSGASDYERDELARSVESEKVFRSFGNVNVVGKGYAINQLGASGLAATLHAAALLLKLSMGWDWFITLSASDYPLMNQDGKCFTTSINYLIFSSSNCCSSFFSFLFSF